MNNFYLLPTTKTPKIDFDSQTGNLNISGRSIPENSIEFYRPVIAWLDEYRSDPVKKTVLHVNLEYFNTSTSKCLVDILRMLEKINESHEVMVYWYYEKEDEDMLESGEDFKKILKIPIELVILEGDEKNHNSNKR